MSDRPGCLFGIPARLLGLARGTRAITVAARPAHRAPHPEELDAVRRGKLATERTLAALHQRDSISPDVLDDVTTAVQALGDTVHALADRLAAARAWLTTHDAEALRHRMVELELDADDSLAATRARTEEAAAIRRQLRHIAEIEQGIPALRARLSATVRELEQLEAKTTKAPVDGLRGADGLAERSRQQLDQTTRALAAWSDTVAELDGID